MRAVTLLTCMVVLVGCGPLPSPTGNPPDGVVQSSQPTPSTSASPESAVIASGVIDQGVTTPALEFRSTGQYLLWSTGARVGPDVDVAPDLYGATPGGDPVLLYDNPNRDSRLELVGGDGARIAFVELNPRLFGLGGWKLWYMPQPNARAILIDHRQSSQLPFFAIDGDRLIWTVGNPDRSELVLVNLGSMKRRVLLSSRSAEMQYWFPALDGSHLVYGTVELAPDALSDQRHVYLMNLGTSEPPRRLDDSESASEPAVAGDDVVWKESDPTENFLNSGSLVHYSLSTGKRTELALGIHADGFQAPSIGDGFVAAWSDDDRRLDLADLRGGGVSILDMPTTTDDPHDAVVRPSLHSNLLAYVFGPAGGALELRWARLATNG